MAVSIIRVAELYYGAACSDNPDANRKAVSDFTGRLAVLPINSEAAALFGSIKGRLREAGTLIEDMDLLIAATALAYDMTLVTNNVRHFDRIPNMRLESWASGV
jgi:tRNA(fMet)-specific endonuclease VapC